MLASVSKMVLGSPSAFEFLAGTHMPALASLELVLPVEAAIKQVDLVQRTSGLLQVCQRFGLKGKGESSDELGTLAVLSALSAAWQHAASDAPKHVDLTHLHCTPATLAQLPQNLTGLMLW
jgi:hypothetical protein